MLLSQVMQLLLVLLQQLPMLINQDMQSLQDLPPEAASVAAFRTYVLPLERAQRTRSKALTHRQTIVTWAIWKGVLQDLLPMSDDRVRAYIWDCLAFEASLSVLKHALDAIKGWHRHLGIRIPFDGPGDYRGITTSLARFQPSHRIAARSAGPSCTAGSIASRR